MIRMLMIRILAPLVLLCLGLTQSASGYAQTLDSVSRQPAGVAPPKPTRGPISPQAPSATGAPLSAPKKNISKVVIRRQGAPKKYYELQLGFLTWQELIGAKRGVHNTNIVAQSLGVEIGMRYNRFFSPTWRYSHSATISLGGIKGKGKTNDIQDEIKNQNWMALTLAPGLMYRTSPVSELGFALPVTYRQINWRLQSGTAFKLDKQRTYSAGIQGLYVNRFTAASSVQISITHQHMWDTVIWGIAWIHKF